MKPGHIHHNVSGAPFKVGERVRVTDSNDETFDPRYQDRTGIVEYFEYQCGCGQKYPNDPMIGVRFSDNVEEFWSEELVRSSSWAREHLLRGTSRKVRREPLLSKPVQACTQKL
jgi:antirepressor CarS-like protein